MTTEAWPAIGADRTVDVILPTLDEAGALPWVLTRMPPGYRPIVVDNGSIDGSAAIARAHGAQVVVETRRGFGAACFAGLLASTSTVIAFMDADASLDPEDLDVICAPVLDGTVDLLMGARAAEAGAWPWHARQANQLLARQISRRTGSPISDLGPMRAVNRRLLIDVDMTDRGFGWPLEMVLKGALQGWRIQERSVPYRPRIGKSKVSGTVRGTLRAGRDMGRILREQH